MKKGLIVFLIFAFVISSCNQNPNEQLPQSTETLKNSPTTEYTATSTMTSSSTPTITATPTPSVTYKLNGLDFGPYTEAGQNPDLGTILPADQLEKRLDLLSPYTDWIRTYGCVGFEQIVPLAHDLGLKVALSAWLGKDESANAKEISCLVKTAVLYQPEILIVGSETLHRGDLSAAQLIDTLQMVKTVLPDIPVTTADTYASWQKNKEVIEASDIVFANIYPYWQGIDIDHAISWLDSAYFDLKSISGEKEVWISETGWPDAGNTIREAIPSEENAAAYLLNFVSWARATNTDYFYFEAFDEPWKKTDENPQEAHWGIWTSDYAMKEGMELVFKGNSIADNWTPTETPVPTIAPTLSATKKPTELVVQGPPAISIALPNGKDWPDGGVVSGYARNIDPSKYRVAVYIKVNGGWWTKPFFDSPLTRISANGYWESYYITGGDDASANEIVAFLVPSDFNAPLANGGGLPELGNVPSVKISR